MKPLLRDTLVEINLDNIAFNMQKIKQVIGENVAVGGVIKANAYGHGAVDIAPEIIENGGDYLCVAALTEALELRKYYKNYKIMIMGYTPDEYLGYVVNNNITQTVFSYRQGKILSDLGEKYNKRPVVHIKYDTGFNRLGFKDCAESIEEIDRMFRLNIDIEGIFSHFALTSREEDDIQYKKFINAVNKLKLNGRRFKYTHICDSISAIDYPEYRLNMIRPGAIIYGLKSYKDDTVVLKPAMTFKTKIYHIKTLEEGEGIGYSYSWKAKKKSVVGTLPFGYADGYPRCMNGKGVVTIHGKRVPVIGTICMDQCMVDLTDIPEANTGDEVIIYGDGTHNTVDVEEMSKLAKTNKNDIISRISRRTPRVYIKGGKIVNVVNYLF